MREHLREKSFAQMLKFGVPRIVIASSKVPARRESNLNPDDTLGTRAIFLGRPYATPPAHYSDVPKILFTLSSPWCRNDLAGEGNTPYRP
jgi:hypothetical protein